MALDRYILRNIIISLLFFVLLVNKKTGKFHWEIFNELNLKFHW